MSISEGKKVRVVSVKLPLDQIKCFEVVILGIKYNFSSKDKSVLFATATR